MSRRILTASGRARFTALAMCLVLIAATFALTSSAQVVGNPVVGTPTMQVARQGHTATLLADGRVLIVGGENASGPVSEAEIFDPALATFSVAAHPLVSRTDHAATLLTDGRVLVTGGRQHNDDPPLDSTEAFDPKTNSFTAVTPLHHTSNVPSARLLAV